MRINELKVPADETIPTSNAPLGIVVIYENFPALLRIQHVYWMLTRELSDEFDLECSWYGFDDLHNPRAATSARAAAADADLILFSVDVDTEPPRTVKTWIESWIGVKATQDAALAALLNNAKGGNQRVMPVRDYLNRIAQRAGMSFLPEIIEPAGVCGPAS